MLFTVSATFSDFTVAYEQYEAANPTEALATFFSRAAALQSYNSELRASAARATGHRLTHVADGKRGLWVWHPITQLEYEQIAVYGGSIIQTDPSGLVRGTNNA